MRIYKINIFNFSGFNNIKIFKVKEKVNEDKLRFNILLLALNDRIDCLSSLFVSEAT